MRSERDCNKRISLRRVATMVVAIALLLFTVSKEGAAQRKGISINLPLLLVGSYNIELSYLLTQQLSLHLPLAWSPHTLKENLRVKHLTLMGGVRWWKWHGYTSFFTGHYLGYSHYNLSPKEYRYQGDLIKISTTIGWSKMLSPRWNLEVEGGVAVALTSWERFDTKRCGLFRGAATEVIVIPSNIGLSLLYIF